MTPHPESGRPDYTSAIYGSLLAASVIAGTETVRARPRVELIVLLLVTGLVFWAAHVYAHLVGGPDVHYPLTWREVREVCVLELPIITAAIPPVAAVAVAPLFGLAMFGTALLALTVAVAEQVAWATISVVKAGLPHSRVVLAGAVNLLLGLLLVVFKEALHH